MAKYKSGELRCPATALILNHFCGYIIIVCFNSRSAQECRAMSEIIEKRLLHLAEEQERLAKALNEVC